VVVTLVAIPAVWIGTRSLPGVTNTPAATPTYSPNPTAPTSTGPPDSCYSNYIDVVTLFEEAASHEKEREVQDRFMDHAFRLVEFLCEQQVDTDDFEDPIVGNWNSSEGYFTFDAGAFYWYRSVDVTGDYYRGHYLWYPGCELSTGWTLDKNGRPCMTILQKYTGEKFDGVASERIFYGVFSLTLVGEDIQVRNQRTGGDFVLRPW
jgi:hypothetical protein